MAIDRRALVRRHNPAVRQFDPFSALTVGNGRFAFTADVTGLQTFAEECRVDFPLCTTADWAWHTAPIPPGAKPEDFRDKPYDAYGRAVGYPTDATGQEPLYHWLRRNPHRLHLGRIGLELRGLDGAPAGLGDLTHIGQHLDLWTGLLDSRFEVSGQPVRVLTCCHPDVDLLAVRIESPLLADGRLGVRLAFPYGSPEMDMADWDSPDRHQTACDERGGRADFSRTLDNDRYTVSLTWSAGRLERRSEHEYALSAAGDDVLEFVAHFAPSQRLETLPDVSQTQLASAAHWEEFWTGGGAIDLSASTDARAAELERRIVLSQYNTALHCAGCLPAQETGLLFNSWYGKFHLEMHWWHVVHFTAWNRFDLFERSLGLYERILPIARRTAGRQGYDGARWPKMIGPDGNESPSACGPLLIWQQPHPIYYAELCYRHEPTAATLRRWQEIVFATADFMASFAVRDPKTGRYCLGPPMMTVSENTDPLTSRNPTFELAYWRWGLNAARQWRERLGLPSVAKWDDVLAGLAELPEQDGVYLMQEGMADTYTTWNWEHPGLLGAYGVLPGSTAPRSEASGSKTSSPPSGEGVDLETMHRTVCRVIEAWQWDRSWGWDFPSAAMAAARVGEPELAVKALLLDARANRYLPNGHNFQWALLPAYLPGNGGLLAAVAMMAAGWTGSPDRPAPGFPADGTWSVQWENLSPWM